MAAEPGLPTDDRSSGSHAVICAGLTVSLAGATPFRHRAARCRSGAAQWLKEEYVEGLYGGSLLTDFDQRAPDFGHVGLFTLDQVLSSPELAGMTNSTHKIDVPDKGTFYRIEAGPLDEAAAKSTCTNLRGQGLGCIVVKH